MPKGNPGQPKRKKPALEHFFRYVAPQKNGCWLWTGAIDKKTGRARFRKELAYRFAYKELIGPIPSDRPQLDHLCHSENLATCAGGHTCLHRRCVNVYDHIEPVTNQENSRRGHQPTEIRIAALAAVAEARRQAEFCERGHPFDEKNTYWRNNHTQRGCRECHRIKYRERYARNRVQMCKQYRERYARNRKTQV